MAVVTITRGKLQVSFQLADLMARRLGCEVVRREDVIARAQEHGIDEFTVAQIDELASKPPQFWDRQAVQRRHYLTIFKESLMAFVAGGNVVYHGNVGPYLITDVPHRFRVRLTGSLAYRAEMLANESAIGMNAAKDMILLADERRARWVKLLCGADFYYPPNYDVYFNLDRVRVPTMVDMIDRAIAEPEFVVDEAAQAKINDACLCARVRAALVRSMRTRGMELTVSCQDESGEVHISGLAPAVGLATWENDIRDAIAGLDAIRSLTINDRGKSDE
ncbi:MAG: cytidylate kinase family protein [candidate division Zixibacteria bacterium]|nr:cytidylate kinase family protein [candidate division Zixibacteria bacterium]